MSHAESSASPLYVHDAEGTYRTARAQEVLNAALELVDRLFEPGVELSAPRAAREYLALHLGPLEHEVFGALFLDAQNRLIEYRELFRGTATQTSVYPREIVKEALHCNAVAAILVHNHPSGNGEPSRADEYLTQTLKAALTLIDVRVLDHLVVAGTTLTSFAERGLL